MAADGTQFNQQDFWDQRAGAWERRADSLDTFADVYGNAAIDALDPQPGWRVLDVGCGPGTTLTKLADRVGPSGEVVGADISGAMIAAAERRAANAGVTNARFLVADVEVDTLGEDYDGVYSRFGVMFFPNPVNAFANLRTSLKGGGRLACAVWSGLDRNPWMFVPTAAALEPLEAELNVPGPDEPGPFSLADPDKVRRLLGDAGFDRVAIEPVAGERVVTEATAAEDIRMLLEIGPMSEAYGAASEEQRQAALEAVVQAIEPYRDGEGWRLPGAALIVTATAPG